MSNTRVRELVELAATEGFTLPLSAEAIVALEDQGHVVDLTTGQILNGGANDRFSLTVGGEAVAVVDSLKLEW